jgi:hypothetical protein
MESIEHVIIIIIIIIITIIIIIHQMLYSSIHWFERCFSRARLAGIAMSDLQLDSEVKDNWLLLRDLCFQGSSFWLLGKYLTWRTKYMCLYLNKQTCPSMHPFFLLFIFFIYSLSILSIPNIFLVFSIKCRPSKSEF